LSPALIRHRRRTGFAKVEAPKSPSLSADVELPVALTVAGGKEIVEVSAQADLVETSRTYSTDTIGERRSTTCHQCRNYINYVDGFAGRPR